MNRKVSILGPLVGFVLLSMACSFAVDLGQSSQTKISMSGQIRFGPVPVSK